MLKNLIIKNIALIEQVDISFDNGLNILSGETGAGKSVILDSLNFVLGAKADKSMIRHGQDFCSVKAVFDISNNDSAKNAMISQGFDEDDTLIIFRKFSISGNAEVKLNGEPISVSSLKKITQYLVDVHGQSEHFYLLKETNQLELIDRYAGQDVLKIKEDISKNVKNLKEINKNLESLGGDEQQRAIKLDILTYQINEIEKVDFKENEDVELGELKVKLQNQSKITDALNMVKQALSGEYGSTDTILSARSGLGNISDYSEEYQALFDRIDNVYTEVSDLSDTVSDILDNFDFSEYSLEKVNERLADIKKIKTKYGTDYAQVQEFLDNAKKEVEQINNFDVLAEKYLEEKESLKKIIYSLYTDLRKTREKYSKEFSSKIVLEIQELNMKNANFSVNFNEIPNIDDCDCLSNNGFDEVEFLFSANLGEPLKPLSKIISGGEISRFMLAIKAQTAKYNDVTTFVFDEIDAGISGETAFVVGEKFIKLSNNVQIIAITHLPQIASMGDTNFLIKKIEDKDKTFTTIMPLDYENKILEVLRLVGGNQNDSTALNHAKNLVENAEKLKKSYKN